MGAFSPHPIITKELEARIITEIIEPVIHGMRLEGHEYSGFLYAGLMIDDKGNPKTLEFNCRFGDPETQPIMLRLESDLAELIMHGINGTLDQATAMWSNKSSVGIVLAAHGYPDSPQKNDIIYGLENVTRLSTVKVFHSGTKLNGANNIVTNGGRV